MSIWTQKSALIQLRTSLLKFDDLAEKFERSSVSNFSTKVPAALMPVWVMSLMAATQAALTRTPLATVFMLGLSAGASAQLSVLLPPVIIAAYVAVCTTHVLFKASFFPYKTLD